VIGEGDARAAGEVVVTGASLAQRLALVDRAQADRARGVAGDP
jgi:hypothetical protein